MHQKKKFDISFSKAKTKFFLSFHYNGNNSYLFINVKNIYKFKGNNKNINFPNKFCLGSISNKFDYFDSEEVSLKESVHNFSVDYDAIKSDMLELVRKVLIGLLCFSRSVASIVNNPGHTKCISLNNEQCMTQCTFINLDPENIMKDYVTIHL